MGGIGTGWNASDWQNERTSWQASGVWNQRTVIFRKFLQYETKGDSTNPDATFRVPVYQTTGQQAWLSQVKVFDTVRGGYFTTGDLSCNSEFLIRGSTPAYTLESGITTPEYAGDEIEWNGKVWKVADEVEPVQMGPQGGRIWYNTTLRRSGRSGVGVAVGP